MSDRAPRCRVCGRLAARLEDGCCDGRCRELARAGYRSPGHDPAALAAPRTAVEGRVLVGAEVDCAIVPGCTPVAKLPDGRTMVRVAADEWTGLHDSIAELRDACAGGELEIFSLQQFTPGGLSHVGNPNDGERQ